MKEASEHTQVLRYKKLQSECAGIATLYCYQQDKSISKKIVFLRTESLAYMEGMTETKAAYVSMTVIELR